MRRWGDAVGVFAAMASAAACWAGPAPAGGSKRPEVGPRPTLAWLRDCIVKRGAPPRLVKVESVASERLEGEPDEGSRRIVFWTKTRRLTQTVIVAIVAGGAYVRVQSSKLAIVPGAHPRLLEVMSYMLDRNFAMSGAQFARDATDGELVVRADVPCAHGLREKDFLRVLETVLRTADDETPRLRVVLGEGVRPTAPAGDGKVGGDR
jgi:hypothetical protein